MARNFPRFKISFLLNIIERDNKMGIATPSLLNGEVNISPSRISRIFSSSNIREVLQYLGRAERKGKEQVIQHCQTVLLLDL
jgi:hypothetical protein